MKSFAGYPPPNEYFTHSISIVLTNTGELPAGLDDLFKFISVRYRTWGALQRCGCHPSEATDAKMGSYLSEVQNRI